MALDPRQMLAFLTVTEQGSLGRAADIMHLTQPALSRIIHRLEAQLGVALFERHTLGMTLTSYGETLLPYARLLSVEAANAIEEINALRGLGRGVVRIGAIASAAIMLLPPILERLLARWPGLHVQITEAVEDRLLVALTRNEIDLAIAGLMPETEAVMRVAEHKFQDDCRIIAAIGHPLHQRATLCARDVLDYPWAMPPREATPRQQFEQIMRGLGVEPPEITIETRSVSVIRMLVVQSGFLTWMPDPLSAMERKAGLVRGLEIEGTSLRRPFFIYRRRQGLLSPASVKLLEELRRADNQL